MQLTLDALLQLAESSEVVDGALLGLGLLLGVLLLALAGAGAWSYWNSEWRGRCPYGFERAAASDEEADGRRDSRESVDGKGAGVDASDEAESSHGGSMPSSGKEDGAGRRSKTHIFLILGHDYFQKVAKLNPRSIDALPALHATVAELFAQELFAHELVSRRVDGGRASAEPARGAKLQIAQMEMQYLDAQCGAPTLVTAGTPIASVLASSALLLSDRPVAEMVAQGCHSSDGLHARSCEPSWCTGARKKARARAKRQLGGQRNPLLLSSHASEHARAPASARGDGDGTGEEQRPASVSRRLLMLVSPAEGGEATSDRTADVEAGGMDHEGCGLMAADEAVVAVPAAFFRMRDEGRLDSDLIEPAIEPAGS